MCVCIGITWSIVTLCNIGIYNICIIMYVIFVCVCVCVCVCINVTWEPVPFRLLNWCIGSLHSPISKITNKKSTSYLRGSPLKEECICKLETKVYPKV